MSESLDKAYATQIANIEKSTGKKLSDWIALVNKSGFAKHGELVNFLKEKHGGALCKTKSCRCCRK